MIEETKDLDALILATESVRDRMSPEDCKKVLEKEENIMFLSGRDVSLAIFDYPGIYTVHWYYPDTRGRGALDLAKACVAQLFTTHGAKVLRGLTPEDARAARWAARQIGMKSEGFIDFQDNDGNPDRHEILCMTLDQFNESKGKN